LPDNAENRLGPKGNRAWLVAIVVVYILLVLGVDMLAAMRVQWPFPWVRLEWHLSTTFPSLRGTACAAFDVYKFLFWLVIPFVACLWRMDWRYLLFSRWKKWDLILVGGLAVLGMAVMFIIPHVPALKAIYPSMGALSIEQKMAYVQRAMLWNVSWIFGWEFLHRYCLLRVVQVAPLTGRWGLPAWKPSQWYWLAVPISETLYHLQKPGLEAVGMFAFSVVLTLWCLKRKNWLLACLVHLIIEVELLLFMTVLA
jgi:hypothetical protein